MNFDLRLPIGILFSIYGLLLAGFGLLGTDKEIYHRSLDININLGWGLVLLVFGGAMLLGGLERRQETAAPVIARPARPWTSKIESPLMTPLEQLASETSDQFAANYGRPPRWVVAAPGRVNLIGEHTDYNGGFVLPMAVERYTVMAADAADGTLVKIRNSSRAEPVLIDTSAPIKPGRPAWGNYLRGVLAGMLARGMEFPGLDVLVNSSVPLGAGLSSSAALEVSLATLLESVSGAKLEPVEKALLCQQAEHDFAGVPCGIMDQFISVMGREDHLLLLDCRSHQAVQIPLNDPAVTLLIVNTNVKHQLAGGEYARRRAECETAARILGVETLREADLPGLERARTRLGPEVFRRARHVTGEIARTVQAAEQIRKRDWKTAGRLMYESHDSLRDDFEVSCRELDAVVETARDIGLEGGVFGCRMTGGGFGGCAVALVQTEQAEEISAHIARLYGQQFNRQATLFSSRPAGGATVMGP